jgi:hypothetical protein
MNLVTGQHHDLVATTGKSEIIQLKLGEEPQVFSTHEIPMIAKIIQIGESIIAGDIRGSLHLYNDCQKI